MVREIIHLSVGQCGNQIGCKFWETVAFEHGLDKLGIYTGSNAEQLEKLSVFYREGRGNSI